MFRSLSNYNYRVWFIGALVSNVGAWMQATTQNWVVLTDLTDNDAVAVGTTMALQFGPQLLLVPITGLIADRFDRRTILFFTQSALMLLGIALGLLLLLGHAELWHLYVFALLLGIVNAIDGPARQTFVSDLVSEHNMANAVALNSASFNAARMIGPALAGFLIVLIGSGWVFIANAATFIAVLIALAMLNSSRLRRMPRAPRARGQFVEGFRYVAKRPDLIVVFVIVFLVGAFAMNFPIVSSTMAVEFGRGAGEYGLLSSILAIGSLSGALLAARREKARFGVIIVAVGGLGVASLLSALMPSFWTFAFSLIFIGFSAVTMLTTANGFVQTTTEPAVRGRVMALYMAVLMGGTPVGAPIVGAVANAMGPRWALGVAAVAGVVGFAIGVGWLVIARELRLQPHPQARWRLVLTHSARPLSSLIDAAVLEERTDGRIDGVRMPVPITTSSIAVVSENRVTPEVFSEEIALTSPIPLPKFHRDAIDDRELGAATPQPQR
ncbi:MFS transporter [Microterricola viridarii]|uniref:MFS transporter n=1 Tax=Microterricola viridarii TaxID=412690 RepID=A0A109QXD0_9MICO|nr:MFS transporter [Microterricola viridarii]AMB59764.1 MFS transporter [Microterricola viridarii]